MDRLEKSIYTLGEDVKEKSIYTSSNSSVAMVTSSPRRSKMLLHGNAQIGTYPPNNDLEYAAQWKSLYFIIAKG